MISITAARGHWRKLVCMNKRAVITIVALTVFICLIAVIVIQLFPLIKEVVTNVENESNAVQYIESYGAKGIPILIFLSALQVILIVIPSAAIQILSGLCYGIFRGTLMFIAGSTLGNVFVFISMRKLRGLIEPFFNRNPRKKRFLTTEQLSRMKRPELAAFFCFLIPGIPNGIIPYLFAETGASMGKYIAAAAAGSIPSSLVCVFLGDRISRGRYSTAVIISAVVAVAVLFVLLYRKKLINMITHESD